MADPPITLLVLGAGASRRYQASTTPGTHKLWHPLPNGRCLMDLTLTRWAEALATLPEPCHVASVQVVVRPIDLPLAHPVVQTVLQKYPNLTLQVLPSPDCHLGMGHSLATAVATVPSHHAVVVALADMPFVSNEVIHQLLSALQQGADRVRPRWIQTELPANQWPVGHPVGWAPAWLPKLAQIGGDQGAKALLAITPNDITWIDTHDPGVVQDIDRWEDWA
jgi:molybdenum cofactor cytidylyltransferase